VVWLSQSLRANFASSVRAIGSAEDLDQCRRLDGCV